MKRLLLLTLLCLIMPKASAQDITGKWYGKFEAGIRLVRITFDIQEKDGNYTASMQNPDAPVDFKLDADKVLLSGDSIKIKISNLMFEYSGQIISDSIIQGRMQQMGATFALDLSRNAPEIYRPQEPKPPYPYNSEDVAFENKETVMLSGTLTTPEGPGPFPAVMLLSGSGLQNRDSWILHHRPFLVLADYLTRRGIAVLRVDDRGFAKSNGIPTGDIDKLADDAEAGIAYLKSLNNIDPDRIGLIGHSQGGEVAFRAASRGLTAFVVSLAGVGVSGRELLSTQREALIRAEGAPDEFVVPYLETMNRVSDLLDESDTKEEFMLTVWEILKGTPLETTNHEQYWQPDFKYMLRSDPTGDLESLRVPLLALNGGKDLQVVPGVNLEAIRSKTTAAGNSNVTIKEYPGLNHLFQTAATGRIQEYGQIEETFNEEVMKDIADWILSQ